VNSKIKTNTELHVKKKERKYEIEKENGKLIEKF